MTPLSPESGEPLIKVASGAIDGPVALSRAIAVATLTVAECLAECIDCGMASDVHDIKNSLVRKAKADGETAAAGAQKQLAEADATRIDAETRRMLAEAEALARIMDAKSRLIEAIVKLRQEGGEIFLDREALQKMLNAGLPAYQTSDQRAATETNSCAQHSRPGEQ